MMEIPLSFKVCCCCGKQTLCYPNGICRCCMLKKKLEDIVKRTDLLAQLKTQIRLLSWKHRVARQHKQLEEKQF
jgi:hypothetical protein